MPANFTLQFGTFTFPNQSFELEGHRIALDTPVAPVRRLDGGEVLPGYLTPKQIRINGKVFGTDKDTVHNDFITLQRAMHNAGVGASLFYRSDRYVFAQLSQAGVVGSYEKGLYEHLINVDMMLVAKRPYAEDVVTTTVTGTRNNACGTVGITPSGNYPTQGVWNIVAGTWGFTGGLSVTNPATGMSFSYAGPMTAGQTLVIDNVLGCVLLQVGLTMVDAISYFGGHLFLTLKDNTSNLLNVCGPTHSFSLSFRGRYYS